MLEYVTRLLKVPTMHSTTHLYPEGAPPTARRRMRPPSASARETEWARVIVGVVPTRPTKTEVKWARDYFDAVHPFAAGGAYVSFMMEERPERVIATDRESCERLEQMKARYDPDKRLQCEPDHNAQSPGETLVSW